MDQIQEKIEIFADHIKSRQKKAGKTLVAEEQKKQHIKLEEAESALQKEKRGMEERNYQVIYRDTNRLIAQGVKEAKEERLRLNAVLRDDFSKNLLKTAAAFQESDIYQSYLTMSVQSIPNLFGEYRDLIVTISESDREVMAHLTDQYLDRYRVTLKTSDSADAVYGGFTVCDADAHFLCDFSLAHLISREQKYIGKRLSELMLPYMEGADYDET